PSLFPYTTLFRSGLADLLGLRTPIGLGQPLEGRELLATVAKDRLELLLLILAQRQLFHEPVADLLRRGRRGARGLAAAWRRGRRHVDAGGPEAEGGVRHLQGARLLGNDELHVRRHSRQQPA